MTAMLLTPMNRRFRYFDGCTCPKTQWTNKHQLSLNNKRDDFNYEDLMAVGRTMGIRFADEKIDQVIDVVSNWTMYALKAEVKKEHVRQISEALRLVRRG